jgi:small GTP-binding protein
MGDGFAFDVFLSHSSKDKAVVRPVAERLRNDGLRVWFDDWVLKPGDSIPAKIERGLRQSRVLVLCMSAQAFGSDWAELESYTFLFRDPLNQKRHFVPLRLDAAPIEGSLAQFLYVDWLLEEREQEYSKLLEACRPPAAQPARAAESGREQAGERAIQLDYQGKIATYAFSSDGGSALTGTYTDSAIRVWDLETARCLRVLDGHTAPVWTVAWSADRSLALSGAIDKTVRLWNVETGRCLRVLEGHTDFLQSVAWSADQRRAISGSDDRTVRLWDVDTGRLIRVLSGHTANVLSVAWSPDQRYAVSAGDDTTIRLWDLETGHGWRDLEGHTEHVLSVAWSADRRYVLSGSDDETVRLWDVETGRCLRVFEGHTDWVRSVAWSADQRHALSCGGDQTVRLWEVDTGRCLRVLSGHRHSVQNVVWSGDQRHAFSGDDGGGIRVWDLSAFVGGVRGAQVAAPALSSEPDRVQYTNAKVLLVGESGVGKTGLSKRLALNSWEASDSTVGAWATHWKLPVSSENGVEREIWLWDFGGQADQRLIHQLYMEDTALAVLVFDGQKEDLFETLGQWDRDLTRASRKAFTKLLVAGRVDAGGLRVGRSQLEAFAKERGFARLLETSAKANLGCEELKEAILTGIRWAEIPWRSSPVLFKRLKEEIIRLKDEGRVLMRFNELRDALRLRVAGADAQFRDEELKAVVGLLAGPGVVWELAFGNWVLLQPERINAYAQAVIQTLRADESERGCLREERVLNGDLAYQSSTQRLVDKEEERFVLLAMHQTLVERGLCLREHTDTGPMLIFPSYYRRERPELVGHPAVLVSYRFNGFLDDIYATLVVRLHHTRPFRQDELWRYAADFKTVLGRKLGVKLTRRAEGAGELEVYFDPSIGVEEKIVFSRYVHEHLLQKGQDIVRLRYYVCPHCGTPVGNREVAMRRLEAWLEKKAADEAAGGVINAWLAKTEMPTIICSECEKRVPLWDELEQSFASAEIQQRVRELQEQSRLVLDNESKERALVGEVISTAALAGQISREFNVSDHGMDMEIEFRDDRGAATGKKVYLQVKSGEAYNDGNVMHWMSQTAPVVLLMRNPGGEVKWMEVREWLKRAGDKRVKQRVLEGERFDVMSVRRWRDESLRG